MEIETCIGILNILISSTIISISEIHITKVCNKCVMTKFFVWQCSIKKTRRLFTQKIAYIYMTENSNFTYIFNSSHQRVGWVRRCSISAVFRFFFHLLAHHSSNIFFYFLRFLSLFCRFFLILSIALFSFNPFHNIFPIFGFNQYKFVYTYLSSQEGIMPLHVKFRNAYQVKC